MRCVRCVSGMGVRVVSVKCVSVRCVSVCRVRESKVVPINCVRCVGDGRRGRSQRVLNKYLIVVFCSFIDYCCPCSSSVVFSTNTVLFCSIIVVFCSIIVVICSIDV